MKSRRISSLLLSCSVLAEAQNIYLYPKHTSLSLGAVTPETANLLLSHHLRLDAFESYRTPEAAAYEEEADERLLRQAEFMRYSSEWGQPFVGEGLNSAVVISVEGREEDFLLDFMSNDAIPITLPESTPDFSFCSLISTYLHRAAHVYKSISSSRASTVPTPELLDTLTLSNNEDIATFLSDLGALVQFLDSADDSDAAARFGAFEIRGMEEIRSSFGSDSQEYQTVSIAVKGALMSAHAKPLRIAILTNPLSATPLYKRQPPQKPFPPNQNSSLPPQEPFFSTSTCYTTLKDCNNSTNSCSGHGTCTNATRIMADTRPKTCFVCACQVTNSSKGSKEKWVGTACERKDISGPFTLLAGTSIALILLIVGAVSLLYTIGYEELPGTLTAGAIAVSAHGKRD